MHLTKLSLAELDQYLGELLNVDDFRSKNNVCVVLDGGDDGPTIIEGANLITSWGAERYAEASLGETNLASNIAGARLGKSNATPTSGDTDVKSYISGSALAVHSAYPVTDDQDPDNSGADPAAATWMFHYHQSEGVNSGIAEIALVNNLSVPTAALCRATFTNSFDKTSTQIMRIFVNHLFRGV